MKLSDSISSLPGVGPVYIKKLKRLGINTIEDLIYHIPHRHLDFSNNVPIKNLKIGENATITGQILTSENVYTKTGKVFQVAKISDGVDTIEAVWMRRPWIIKSLKPATVVSVSGKLSFWGKKRAMMFPEYELFTGQSIHTGRLVPVYPQTEGITSKWLRKQISKALSIIEVDDFLNWKELNLNSLDESIKHIHLAENKEDFDKAFKRLSFNELLMLQIENNLNKLWWKENLKAKDIKVDDNKINNFYQSLPFTPTTSQLRAISEIINDMTKQTPMNRLLEGDVGSGKTLIAAAGAYIGHLNSQKTIIMAPTQILAQQHFETLNKVLSPHGVRIDIATSDSKTLASEAQVIIGTHALLFRESLVENACLIVIDEQHRFGVKQRAKISELAKNGNEIPHILSMTATPIPRTIALTLYGDLDISTLDELPHGRKKIKTWVVPLRKRGAAESWIDEQIADGSQAFIVCPLIEESEAETLKSVKAVIKEYERIKHVFKKRKVALLHGRMKSSEKTEILNDFKNKKYDILVSTPVIEVGIDVPNATVMVIEAAERFGLAQIHQLRGRVGRGQKESFCLLFTESKSKNVQDKLKAVAKAQNGRELAELDLNTRGPGELLGIRQSGRTELKIAKWDDLELIQKSRDFAAKVVDNQEKYHKVLKYYREKQKVAN